LRGIKKDNFKISKWSASTNISASYTSTDDFYQYNALKLALMSGRVNHIETGNSYRRQRSDRVVGAVL
jgi:aryl-alcohol dehydrogenase-like predicted oxidoreductase